MELGNKRVRHLFTYSSGYCIEGGSWFPVQKEWMDFAVVISVLPQLRTSRFTTCQCPADASGLFCGIVAWGRVCVGRACVGLSCGCHRDDPFVARAERWEDIGFQRDDPASDVRGGGQLCLEQLVYFTSTYNHRAMEMIEGQRMLRARSTELAYPWAAAGINVSRMCASLVGIVGVRLGEKATSPYFKKSRAWALLRDEQTFNEFYCVVFDMLDRRWIEQRATYMQFNEVRGQEITKCRRLGSVRSLGDSRAAVLYAS